RGAIARRVAAGVTRAGAVLRLGPPGQRRAPLAVPPGAAARTVWSWGRQPVAFESNPVPLRLEGLGAARAITAGAYHGLALQPDGSLWAWGRNDRGQLGSGSTGETSGPVRVRDA